MQELARSIRTSAGGTRDMLMAKSSFLVRMDLVDEGAFALGPMGRLQMCMLPSYLCMVSESKIQTYEPVAR